MADRHDVVIIGGGPGGYAAALYGASAGPRHRHGRERTRSAAPACTWAASRPRSCSRPPTVRRTLAGAADFGFTIDEPTHRLRPSARTASRPVIDKLFKGLSALLEEPQGHRATTAPAGCWGPTAVTVIGRRGRRPRGHGRRRRPRDGLGAPHHPRLRRRRHAWCSPPTSCCRPGPPGLGRGHRRRRHRLRVRVDDGRPRHRGDHPRGPAQDPPRLRRGRRQAGRAVLQEAAASTSAPASRSTATSPGRDGGTTRALRRRRVDRRRARRGLGRPPSALRRPRPRRHRGRGRRAGLRRGRRVVPHRRATACGPSATSSPRPSSGPRRLRRGHPGHQGHPRRGPGCRSTTQGPVVHLLPPRGRPSPAISEEAAKAAGYDVVTVEAPLRRQRPGAHHRRDRRHGEGHRREATPTGTAAASSASTWSGPWVTEQLGPGLPRRQLGGRRSTRWRSSSSPTRRCRELFGEAVLALTGRGLHG